jgi:replicative DNA helicase
MTELPQNAEAERTIIAAVLVNPAIMASVEEQLTAEDFFVASNKRVFRAMQTLSLRGGAIDIVAVKNELTRQGEGDVAGADLSAIIDGVPRVTNVDGWAQIIREKAIARSLIFAANKIAERAYRGTDPDQDMVGASMADILAISDKAHGAAGFVAPAVSAKAAHARLEAMVNAPAGIVGLRTGLSEFDALTGGIRKQWLVVIAARPGMGKTAMAITIADNAAMAGKKVAFFSLEMSHEELAARRIAKRSLVSAQQLRTAPQDLRDKGWAKIGKATGEVATSPCFIDDTADLTAQQIRIKARRFKAERGLDLVIVDYLQLVTGDRRYAVNREQEVSGVSRALKQLAKELDVPVVALAQLNRDCEKRTDKRPILSDLRESGGLEMDSDVVLMLYRDCVYNSESHRTAAELLVRKLRDGETFTSHCEYQPDYTHFRDLPENAKGTVARK